MKWMVIILSVFISTSLLSSDQQRPAVADAEFKAQQDAKACSALANTHQEVGLEQAAPVNKKITSQKTDQEKLEDACAVLFSCTGGSYTGNGLPKNLQNLVFENLQEFQQRRILNKYDNYNRHIATFADAQGKNFLAVGSGNEIHIIDPVSWQCVNTLKGHAARISCLVTFIDQEGNHLLISGSQDKTIRIWDPIKSVCVRNFIGAAYDICHLCVLTDLQGKQLLVSGSDDEDDENIYIWDIQTGIHINTFNEHHAGVCSFAKFVNSKGKELLAFGTDTGCIYIWDPAIGITNTLDEHKDKCCCLTTVIDKKGNRLLVSGSWDNTIRFWDPEKNVCVKKISDCHEPNTREMGFVDRLITLTNEQGDQLLISGSEDTNIGIWDPDTGVCIKKLYGHKDGVYKLAMLIDIYGKSLLISGSDDNTIRIWGHGPEEFERAVIDQKDFEKARAIMQELPHPQGGNGLPLPLQQLVADYAVEKE